MKRLIAPFGKESIRLRLIEESDLEATLSWRNRDDARVWFKTTNKLTIEQHLAWFHRYLHKDDDFLFVVEAKGKMVGQAAVYSIQWDNDSAEIGRFLVAPESKGKGYIGKACSELVRFCADTLGLHYVFLEVIETNDRAILIYRQNGFSEERRYDGLIRMGRTLTVAGKV
jgi:diamine N-acetyltransferase